MNIGFYGMKVVVSKYIDDWIKCQVKKLHTGNYARVERLPYTIIVSNYPLERLVIDTTNIPAAILPRVRPYKALLTVVD